MASTFKDLDVYRRATVLADELYEPCYMWPKFHLWSIGIQLLRAADSIGANVAEATGRWHTPTGAVCCTSLAAHLRRPSIGCCWQRRAACSPAGCSERLSDIRRPLNGLIKKAPPD